MAVTENELPNRRGSGYAISMTTAITQPVRGDSFLQPTETIVTRLATADGRFVATFDHQTETYVLYDVRTRATRDLLTDLNEVKRTVADIIDGEHRVNVAIYTAALAQQDPAVAAEVEKMRRGGAVQGRATGSLGIWMVSRTVEGRELAVYVDRADYARLLAD